MLRDSGLTWHDLLQRYGLLHSRTKAAADLCGDILSVWTTSAEIDGQQLSRVFWKAHLDTGNLASFFSPQAIERDGVGWYIAQMAEVRSDFSLEPVKFLRSFWTSYTVAGFEFTRRIFQIADDSLEPTIEAVNASGVLSAPIPPTSSFDSFGGEPYIEPLAAHFADQPSLADLIRNQLTGAGAVVRAEFRLREPRQLELAIKKLWAGMDLEFYRARKLLEAAPPPAKGAHHGDLPKTSGA